MAPVQTNRGHLTIYGATGFTARVVIAELIQGSQNRWPSGFKWSIAGRNRAALVELRSSWFREAANTSVPYPDIIVADVHDQSSLNAMAQQTQLLLNCVGPYRDYGEPVVRACLEARTDYLDLCGEPAFIEKMQLLYHDEATRANITICSAAAFDSVPCDLGVNLCKKLLAEQGAYPSSVEMFVAINTNKKLAVNYATFEAAVKGFSSVKELREGRKNLAHVRPKALPVGPPLNTSILGRVGVSRDTRVSGWLIPYFFSDPAVVRLSQSLTLHMTNPSGTPAAELAPIHFAAHFQIPTIRVAFIFVVHFVLFQFLAMRAWGRYLLYSYPAALTWGLVRNGDMVPSDVEEATFSQTFYARGYSPKLHPTPANTPDVNLVIRISGPEPGYKSTAIILLEVASLLLKRRGAVKKGVLTPAVAFGHLDRTSPIVSDKGAEGGVLDGLQRDGRITWSIVSSQHH
ncbi:hypothetical protein K439DRAFT_1538502 [Ramaria rubella]|nr:hypothetical protein K439DRAFT_1538502 [Ramaria rubella]